MSDDSTRAGTRTTAKFAVFVMLGFLVATGLGLSTTRLMIERSMQTFQSEVQVAKVEAISVALNLLAKQQHDELESLLERIGPWNLDRLNEAQRGVLADVVIYDAEDRLVFRGRDFPNIYLDQAQEVAEELISSDRKADGVIRQSIISSNILFGSASDLNGGDMHIIVAIRPSPAMQLADNERLSVVKARPVVSGSELELHADDTNSSVYRPLEFGDAGLVLSTPEQLLRTRRETIKIVVSSAMIVGLLTAFALIFVMGRRLILRPFAELRRSRELLRNSEVEARRLAVVAEAASDHIMISDKKGRMLWVNQAMVDGTGFAREELVGRAPPEMLFGPATPEVVRSLVVSAYQRQEKASFRSINYKKSGDTYIADVSLTPVSADDGEEVYYVAIERNATETHIAEERLKNAVDAMHDGFAIVSSDGRHRIMNAAYREQIAAYGIKIDVGDTYEDMINQLADSDHMDFEGKDKKDWCAEKIIAFRAATPREYYTTDPTGRTFLRRSRRLPSGETVFLATNVTELNEARARAEAAMEAKSRFTASISHELRTPLNGVISMAALLLDGDLGQSERSSIELIHQSGEGLLAIINDILDYSKLEAGRLALRPEPFDIVTGLEDIAALLTPAAAAKQLIVTFRFDPDGPRALVGDLGRIRQIVTNLMGNAVKFTEQGAVELKLSVKEKAKRAEVLIEVSDTGVGIPQNDLNDIFAPFEQARNLVAVRAQEGTGLGLSICRELALIMGGTLNARSTLGQGSVFSLSVEMPVADQTGANALEAMPNVGGAGVILYADDVFRSPLQDQLVSIGAQIQSAGSASDADGKSVHILSLTAEGNIDGAAPVPGDDVIVIVPHHAIEPIEAVLPYIDARARVLRRPVRTNLLCQTIVEVVRSRAGEADVQESDTAQPAALSKDELPLIVAAEDNPTNRFILQAMLKDAPFRLEIHPDAGSALTAIADKNPSIVLMDVHLPDMSGAEATDLLRQRNNPTGAMDPVILGYTAGVSEEEEQACLDAGMDGFIIKPISRDDLIKRLQGALPSGFAKAS